MRKIIGYFRLVSKAVWEKRRQEEHVNIEMKQNWSWVDYSWIYAMGMWEFITLFSLLFVFGIFCNKMHIYLLSCVFLGWGNGFEDFWLVQVQHKHPTKHLISANWLHNIVRPPRRILQWFRWKTRSNYNGNSENTEEHRKLFLFRKNVSCCEIYADCNKGTFICVFFNVLGRTQWTSQLSKKIIDFSIWMGV